MDDSPKLRPVICPACRTELADGTKGAVVIRCSACGYDARSRRHRRLMLLPDTYLPKGVSAELLTPRKQADSAAWLSGKSGRFQRMSVGSRGQQRLGSTKPNRRLVTA